MKRHPLAIVKFLDEEKPENLAHLIKQCEFRVDDVFGFMNGLTLTS
jgi:hypothetical protein